MQSEVPGGESAGSFVVEGIAEQRMADVGHVDADLVGAAGFEIEFEVGENGAVREGAVMGYGALAGGKVDGALDEGAVEAGDRCVDGAGCSGFAEGRRPDTCGGFRGSAWPGRERRRLRRAWRAR